MTIVVCGGMILCGFFIYEFQTRMKYRKMCEYNSRENACDYNEVSPNDTTSTNISDVNDVSEKAIDIVY